LPSVVDGPPIPHQSVIPALDVSATRTGDRLALFLVNRHLTATVAAEFALKGLQVGPAAKRLELHHPDAFIYNTYQVPQALKISERTETLQIERQGSTSAFSLQLPAHSLTCLVMEAKNI